VIECRLIHYCCGIHVEREARPRAGGARVQWLVLVLARALAVVAGEAHRARRVVRLIRSGVAVIADATIGGRDACPAAC